VFYHILCQSAHRKLQKLGLATIYKDDSDFRKYCVMIDSLPFLPLDKVIDGMTCLKENIPKLALSNVGDRVQSTKLGTKQSTENRLKNVCMQNKNNDI